MPQMRFQMPEMHVIRMPPMQFMPLAEIKMPDRLNRLGGMMGDFSSHFRMMDELVSKLNDRDDWGHLERRDWSTMAPNSARLSSFMKSPFMEEELAAGEPEELEAPKEPYVEEEQTFWEMDFDTPVLPES